MMDRNYDLEEEYQTMEVEYNLKDVQEVAALLEICQDNLVDYRIETFRLIRDYYKRILFCHVFYLWQLFIERVEDVEYYKDDIALLQKEVDLSIEFQGLQTLLISSLTEENCEHIGRLALFADRYFNYHVNYYEEKRDVLRLEQQGISMMTNSFYTRNNMEEFSEFFEKKLLGENYTKGIEKSKKM